MLGGQALCLEKSECWSAVTAR